MSIFVANIAIGFSEQCPVAGYHLGFYSLACGNLIKELFSQPLKDVIKGQKLTHFGVYYSIFG